MLAYICSSACSFSVVMDCLFVLCRRDVLNVTLCGLEQWDLTMMRIISQMAPLLPIRCTNCNQGPKVVHYTGNGVCHLGHRRAGESIKAPNSLTGSGRAGCQIEFPVRKNTEYIFFFLIIFFLGRASLFFCTLLCGLI